MRATFVHTIVATMKKPTSEPERDIDFTHAVRGPVIPPAPGKTKISIRLDNVVIDHFRAQAEHAGGGNYQTLINDALLAFIAQGSVLEAVRQVVKEEFEMHRNGAGPAKLKADVARGLADSDAGRTRELDVGAIKARGRALLVRRGKASLVRGGGGR